MGDYTPKSRNKLPIIFDDRMPVNNLIPKIVNRVNDNTEDLSNLYLETEATGDEITHVKQDINECENQITQLTGTLVTDTATGSIASFPDGADGFPLVDLQVQIEPVQDLHGQANPYPPGGGTNLLDYGDITSSYNITSITDDGKGTFTVVASGAGAYINHLIPVTAGETYVIHCVSATNVSGNASQISVCVVYDGDTNTDPVLLNGVTYDDTSSVKTFTPTENVVLVKCNVTGGNGAGTGTIVKPQVVKGSSKPTTWSPYSNICPITGHTAVTVTRTGVNMWDEEWELGAYNANGSKSDVTDRIRSKNYLLVVGGSSYYLKFPSGAIIFYLFFDAGKTSLQTTIQQSAQSEVISVPSNARYMLFYTSASYGTTYNHDISINYPSTDHDYHPGNIQTVTIDLDGTHYGGTLDVTSGVLTVDSAKFTFSGTESWGFLSDFFYTSLMQSGVNESDDYLTENGVKLYLNGSNGQCRVYLSENTFLTSGSDLHTYLDNSIGFVYKLATPVTVQLTPAQLTTLLGTNNIFADTGNTTAEYYADTKKYITKVIAEALNA